MTEQYDPSPIPIRPRSETAVRTAIRQIDEGCTQALAALAVIEQGVATLDGDTLLRETELGCGFTCRELLEELLAMYQDTDRIYQFLAEEAADAAED